MAVAAASDFADASSMAWVCEACTKTNQSYFSMCEFCQATRYAEVQDPSRAGDAVPTGPDSVHLTLTIAATFGAGDQGSAWPCPACARVNTSLQSMCEFCSCARGEGGEEDDSGLADLAAVVAAAPPPGTAPLFVGDPGSEPGTEDPDQPLPVWLCVACRRENFRLRSMCEYCMESRCTTDEEDRAAALARLLGSLSAEAPGAAQGGASPTTSGTSPDPAGVGVSRSPASLSHPHSSSHSGQGRGKDVTGAPQVV